jgi:SAM-dependent methyltransferase/uncharacterized protein YbaR (Trm112 family)
VKTDLLSFLVCPYCAGTLSLAAGSSRRGDDIEYGILACACSEFPICGGIPIFKVEGRLNAMAQTTDSSLMIGPRVQEIRELIRAGSGEEALMLLLVVPNRVTGRLLSMADSAPPRLRSTVRAIADRSWGMQRVRQQGRLGEAAKQTTGMEMIELYYSQLLRNEDRHYFRCRFGQPRHLAGLALAALLPLADKPILDLACGFGHFMHYWRASSPSQRVIGVDRNFFQLYVARNWVAPGAEVVCSEADARLPFPTQALGGVFCSDAFHYFLRRVQCASEMRRVVGPGGPIILARVGNRRVEPREGYELDPAGYRRLFEGLSMRIVPEETLLESYLDRLGPQLEKDFDQSELENHKWLSLIASEDSSRLRDHGKLESWPHGVGRLGLNPLYKTTSTDTSGNTRVTLEFPSPWYEFENSGCLRYMPRTAAISRAELDGVTAGVRSAETERLVGHCVLVSMPERYC